MPWSSPTPDVERDLASIGRAQRIMSSINLVLFAVVLALVAATGRVDAVGGTLVILVGSVIFLLSLRVRMRVVDEVLEVRGHVRTTKIPLNGVMVFSAVSYQGWWGGYGPLAFPGFRQIDVELTSGRSRSFPATMCTRARAERLADALNELLVEEQITERSS